MTACETCWGWGWGGSRMKPGQVAADPGKKCQSKMCLSPPARAQVWGIVEELLTSVPLTLFPAC